MTEARRTIRVFPDWGHPWPLWEDGVGNYTMDPTDYGLSPGLTELMRSWYDFWERHFDPLSGWDSEDNRAQSREAGDRMVSALRNEVAAIADISDERHRPPPDAPFPPVEA